MVQRGQRRQAQEVLLNLCIATIPWDFLVRLMGIEKEPVGTSVPGPAHLLDLAVLKGADLPNTGPSSVTCQRTTIEGKPYSIPYNH